MVIGIDLNGRWDLEERNFNDWKIVRVTSSLQLQDQVIALKTGRISEGEFSVKSFYQTLFKEEVRSLALEVVENKNSKTNGSLWIDSSTQGMSHIGQSTK